jgi:DNA gyrase/topoisomerase IV subunit A
MDVYPGKVHLRSIPVGNNFLQILDHLKQEKAKPSFISATVNEVAHLLASTNVGNIKIDLKRDVDVFTILDQLKKELSFTKSITPIFNFSDSEGCVYQLTPFLILEKWYIERYRSVLGDLKITQKDLNNLKREIEAKVIVVDNVDKVTNIVKTSAGDEEAIDKLMKAFAKNHLSVLQAKYILTLSLSQLTRYGRDKLLADLDTVNKKIVANTEKFQDVDKIIMDDIVWIKDKYVNKIPRRCILPDYIGCLHMKTGIITISPVLTRVGIFITEHLNILYSNL